MVAVVVRLAVAASAPPPPEPPSNAKQQKRRAEDHYAVNEVGPRLIGTAHDLGQVADNVQNLSHFREWWLLLE